jgi:hypothetical protein
VSARYGSARKAWAANDVANMRKNGVHSVIAGCQACGRKANVNVDALTETIFSPRQAAGFNAANAEGSGSRRDPHGIRDDRKVVKKARRVGARGGQKRRARAEGRN